MPSVDLSGVTDYESFERRYFELLDLVNEALTEDHMFEHPDGTVRNWLYQHEGVPAIGPEPTETHSQYRAVKFNDNGSVSLIGPERDNPAAWATTYDLSRAMASVLIAAMVPAAQEFARSRPDEDPRSVRNNEINRLLRVVDDGWADERAEHDLIRTWSSTNPD